MTPIKNDINSAIGVSFIFLRRIEDYFKRISINAIKKNQPSCYFQESHFRGVVTTSLRFQVIKRFRGCTPGIPTNSPRINKTFGALRLIWL